MDNSDKISILALIISIGACLIAYFAFKRDKKKGNQDLIYQEKISAYKELMFSANKAYSRFYDIVNKVQFYEGKPEDWEDDFMKFSGTYFMMGYEFRDLLFKNMIVIPNHIFVEMDKLTIVLIGFVTSSAHCNTEITFQTYDKLGRKLKKITNLIRKDLNVEKLDDELAKRIK